MLTPSSTDDRRDGRQQMLIIEWFIHVAFEARRVRALMIRAAGQTRDGNYRDVRLALDPLEFAEELKTVHARHPHVAQHKINRAGGHGFQRFDPVPRGENLGSKPFERQARGLQGVVGVFYDQDPNTAKVGHSTRPSQTRDFFGFWNEREPHRYIGAAAGPFAGDIHFSLVRLHQSFDQREADAQPRVFSAGAQLVLAEDFENEWQEFRGNPLPRVAHVHHGLIALPRQRHSDLPSGGRELQRVEQHVPEDLLQAIAVTFDTQRLAGIDELNIQILPLRDVGDRFARRSTRPSGNAL